MEGIGINLTDKIFFSTNRENIIKNDFFFTIYKLGLTNENKEIVKSNGITYPKIYIKGLEQLFKDDDSRTNTMDAFIKSFNSSGNDDWVMVYEKFRDTDEYCAVITCTADTLSPDFIANFQLSTKCIFTANLDMINSIELNVYIDDFGFFFTDLSNRIQYNVIIKVENALYIKKFVVYNNDGIEAKAIHKGENCQISWTLDNDQKASAYLCDENGYIVANLPPYNVQINKDRKFTLTVYNDYHSVTQTLMVYRTLWKKDTVCDKVTFNPDERGHYKFFWRMEKEKKCYLYVHPDLYVSNDLINWELFTENNNAPKDFKHYNCSYINEKINVCYTCENKINYSEYDFNLNKWSKNVVIDDRNVLFAHALNINNRITMIIGDEENIGIFDVNGNSLINGNFISAPDNSKIIAIDTLVDNGIFLSMLCDNKRVYLFNLKDEYKNNIFECPNENQKNIHIVKSNSIYIALDNYMFEVNDREKFTDEHFSPKGTRKCISVLGAKGSDEISAIYQSDNQMEIWNYKF